MKSSVVCLALIVLVFVPGLDRAAARAAPPNPSSDSVERARYTPAGAPGYGDLPVDGTSVASREKKKKKPRRVDVNASEFVYYAATDRIYASVLAESAAHGNSVVEVDPKRARVVRSIPVGPNPRYLALGDDARTAYVAVDGLRIQRVDLVTGQVVFQFTPTLPDVSFELCVVALAAVPGSPGSVVVSFGHLGYTGSVGTAIFDDGRIRPEYLRRYTATQLRFNTSPDVLYAFSNYDTGGGGWIGKVRVDASGLAFENSDPALIGMFIAGRDFAFYEGLVCSTAGRVADLESRKFLGWMPGADTVGTDGLAVDHERGTVFFARRAGYDIVLLEYDLATYRLLSYYVGPHYGIAFWPNRMAVCGGRRLAILDANHSGNIIVYPPGFVKPIAPYDRPDPVPDKGKVRRIPLPHLSFVYDDVSRKIYASTTGGAGNIGNEIVPVDPFAGSVGTGVLMGSEPGTLAVSDGGQYLYVGAWGSYELVRMRLPDLLVESRVTLLRRGGGETNTLEILPIPGRPGSVVVLRAYGPWYLESPGTEGIAIYDDGVIRPAVSPPYDRPHVDSIQLNGAGTTIYGLDNESTGFDFTTHRIAEDGVHYDTLNVDVGGSFGDKLHCVGDVCYTNAGIVIDGRTLSRVGLLPFDYTQGPPSSLRVVPDPAHGRLYQLVGRDRSVIIYAYDIDTLEPLGSYVVPNAAGWSGNFILWDGGRQLAFSNAGAIVLVPASLVVAE
jgi:hypothetical protein